MSSNGYTIHHQIGIDYAYKKDTTAERTPKYATDRFVELSIRMIRRINLASFGLGRGLILAQRNDETA